MGEKRIGIIGIRGYKVIYSGFETFVHQLVKRSAKKLFFTLYVRKGYQKRQFRGKNFETVKVLTVPNKYLETLVYALFSTIESLFLNLDTLLYLGAANTPFIFLQKLRYRKIIVNVDGLDWQRKRWSFLGKFYLKACEKLSVAFADTLIADSQVVLKYYKDKYKAKNIVFIPYGAEVAKKSAGKALENFGLKKNKYFLFTGRLVPENSPEELILAFSKLNPKYQKVGYKCVILGGTYYEPEYEAYVKNLAKKNKAVVLTGFLEKDKYQEMLANAFCYVETKSTGGTHPSLLEAMALENVVIAKKIKVHKEVLGNSGIYYEPKNAVNYLAEKMEKLLENPKKYQKLGKEAKKIQKKNYNWTKVIREYKNLF